MPEALVAEPTVPAPSDRETSELPDLNDALDVLDDDLGFLD